MDVIRTVKPNGLRMVGPPAALCPPPDLPSHESSFPVARGSSATAGSGLMCLHRLLPRATSGGLQRS